MLKPLIDFFLNPANAPIWIIAGLAFAAAFVIADRLLARGELEAAPLPRPAPAATDETPQPPTAPAGALSTEHAALIERAIDANRDRLSHAQDGAEAAVLLRAALSRLLQNGDSAGRRVAVLTADRRWGEAYDLAVALAAAIVPDPGSSPEAKFAAARAWLDASAVAYLTDIRAAIVAAEQARALGARSAAAHAWLGRLYLRRGRLGEAEASFKASAQALGAHQSGDRAALLVDLGDIAFKRGDRPAARAFLEQALALAPDTEASYAWARRARANLSNLEQTSTARDEN